MFLTDEEKERFWKRVTKDESGCWFWDVKNKEYHYGVFKRKGAHIVSFLMHGGVLTTERPMVLHSCNMRACVNPAHLRAGNAAENGDDRRKKFSALRESRVIALGWNPNSDWA